MAVDAHKIIFALVFTFLCCISSDASALSQEAHRIRGSMKLAARSADSKDQSQNEKQNDDDDDGDEDDDEDDEKVDPKQAKLENELDENVRQQVHLKETLEHLDDKIKSESEIETSMKIVSNETQSPAMAQMLGRMWKELRMFELPSFTKHIQSKLQHLKKEQHSIEKDLADVEKSKQGKKTQVATKAPGPARNYGHQSCQCVGIDELEGETVATLRDGSDVSYPADLGARCDAWDLKDHPKCPGEDWCKQKWCYVDPCKCNIDVLPKPSVYIPGAKYQGKPLHFSYATCGGKDSYSATEDEKTIKAIEKTCAVDVDPAVWGVDDCRCVGIGPQPGTTKVFIDDKWVEFPADTGSRCKAWEQDNHPDCRGSDPPEWCSKAWCYVDPCSCSLATAPKTSSYVPDSSYQGKPVYYSYRTCGETDSYTAGSHKTACVNQKTAPACGKLDKCAWTGKECLGKELVEICDGPHSKSAASSMGFLLSVFGFVLMLL